MINGPVEGALYQHIIDYCNNSKGIHFLGLGGTETHIHLAIEIEPSVPLTEWIGKVKGSSSHAMNEQFGKGSFEWQRGYAVVSFAKRNLKAVLDYIANQKEHHRRGTVNSTLERFGEDSE